MRKTPRRWLWYAAAVATMIAMPSAARAQGCRSICHADEFVSGEDAQNCYCTKLADRQQFTESVNAIAAAARYPGCIGSTRCNFFVARVGETRNVPYFRDVIYPGKGRSDVGGPDEQRQADAIYDFISRAVGSRASGWHAVSGDDAQMLANTGKFVIAVAHSAGGAEHGHIAIVTPAQMSHADDDGSAPWVRDSQSPGISRRANFRFSRRENTRPVYAAWDPGQYH